MAGKRRAEATPSFGRLCPAMTKKANRFQEVRKVRNAGRILSQTLRRDFDEGIIRFQRCPRAPVIDEFCGVTRRTRP